MQLRLAHDAGKAERQAIVIRTGIVELFAICDDHAKQGTQFKKLMPVPIVARQTRGVEADHQPGIAQADLSDRMDSRAGEAASASGTN